MNKLCKTILILLLISAPGCKSRERVQSSLKSQLTNDARINRGASQLPWMKFTIELDSGKIHLQNSNTFKFHYDFASEKIPQFKGLSREDFDKITLFKGRQRALLGILFFPDTHPNEIGIQFVGSDPYDPGFLTPFIKQLSALYPGKKAIYIPTTEQQVALTQKDQYNANGIAVGKTQRWISGDQCYASGVSFSRLVKVKHDEVDKRLDDGSLSQTDIIYIDKIPAELPFFRGIISQSPTTPNSHVALLSESFKIPFGYRKTPLDPQMMNQNIVLSVNETDSSGCELKISEVKNLNASDLLKLKNYFDVKPVDIAPYTSPSELFILIGDKKLSSSQIGGKSANFQALRRALPTNSPLSYAFTFKLWDELMQEKAPKSLHNFIQANTSNLSFPPKNYAQLRENLKSIREKIKAHEISNDLKVRILDAINNSKLDSTKKIRFRSSTNVEDSEYFSGAGLYDSYSGCILDDLDQDSIGPSKCDSTQPKERGVLRAIKKVMASFYNDNAFLERLRHKINEKNVAMGVLVHNSFPDENELANGVATTFLQMGAENIKIVSRSGANSVTNPDDDILPEVVNGQSFSWGGNPLFTLIQSQSNNPPDSYILSKPEYIKLFNMMKKVKNYLNGFISINNQTKLDFEYKKIKPQQLIVKQVRPIPQPAVKKQKILLGVNHDYCTFQGETGDVFSIYYLRGKISFKFKTQLLTTNIHEMPLLNIIETVTYTPDNKNLQPITGSLDPNGKNRLPGLVVNDATFSFQLSGNTYRIRPDFSGLATNSNTDFINVEQARVYISAETSNPRLGFVRDPKNFNLTIAKGSQFGTDFRTCAPYGGEKGSKSVSVAKGDIKFDIKYETNRAPSGISAGFTAHLVKMKTLSIRGLTKEAITITNEKSVTFRPEHHNFSNWYMIDPFAGDNLNPNIADELRAKNIAKILFFDDVHSDSNDLIYVIDPDDNFRKY